MKKHYGPIVLGIIALTLAAPVVQTTTVLADEAGNTSAEETTSKDGNADETPVEGDKDASGKTDTDTDKASTDEGEKDKTYSGTIDLALAPEGDKNEIPVKGINVKFDKLDTYENKTLDFSSIGHDGKTYILVNKDGNSLSETHSVVPMKIDKDNKITVDPNYLNENGQLLHRNGLFLTVEGVNSQANFFMSKTSGTTYNQFFSSSNPDKLKALCDAMGTEIKEEQDKLSADMTLDQLNQVEKSILETVSKYTSTVDIHIAHTDNKDSMSANAQQFVPVIPGEEVFFPNYTGPKRDEFISIKYNADGTKIESAKVTDAANKEIPTNTVVTVWMSNFVTSEIPDYAVTTKNSAVTIPSHHSSHHSSNNQNSIVEPVKPTNDNTPTDIHNVSEVTFLATPYSDTRLFDDNGKVIESHVLASYSAWKVDKFMTINNILYGRVATNQWVKISTGLRINSVNTTVKTNSDHITRLYHSNGKEVANRALAPNTDWHSDMYSTMDNKTVYRVATDEWAAVDDLK